jgi:hypothetical protein
MRFERTTSALDRLADALRRADASWRGGEVFEWHELTEAEREQWRTMARRAARAVLDEIKLESRRGISS